jgi:hypothetical protein
VAPNVGHLQLIQAVITRMAGNSFLLKGWSVSLVAGLSALTKAEADASFGWIALGVVVVFAFLDAYYLALERAYRKLYDTTTKAAATDWSLAVSVGPSDVVKALGSFAIWPLHGAVAVGALIVSFSA